MFLLETVELTYMTSACGSQKYNSDEVRYLKNGQSTYSMVFALTGTIFIAPLLDSICVLCVCVMIVIMNGNSFLVTVLEAV